MKKMQRIQSPEGVAELMRELWLEHQLGSKGHRKKEYWVDFPPLTEEEKAEIEAKKKAELETAKEKDDKPEDLFGAWI